MAAGHRQKSVEKTLNNENEDLAMEMSIMMANTCAVKTPTSLIERCFPFGFRDEALALVKITFPFALGNVFASWTVSFVALVMVGHARGQTELNACALALSTYVLIGNTIMIGLNFGCDTLLPQCYGGNKRKMGLTIQRAALITTYSCLVSWTLMLNAKYLLKLIEHDQHVVRLADGFLRSFLAAIPFDGLSMLLQKYIASNEKTWPLLIINSIGNIVNALLNYILLYKFHMGLRAVSVSMTVSFAVIALCALLYIRFSSIYADTWYPINRECLKEWDIYLRLSIPGVLMVMTEYWFVELSIFFAARLNARSLSAQVCAYQTAWLFYLVTTSYSTAANIRIGQFLGSGKPKEAANSKNVTYVLGAFVILLNMSLIILNHYWFPYAYNTEADALPLARRVLLLIAIVQIWDGYNIISTGIIKACGRQKFSAPIAFIGFYLIGVPIVVVLMYYVRIDIYGFWIGFISAETITNAILFFMVHLFKWDRHAEAAIVRINFNPTQAKTDISYVTHSDETPQEIKNASENVDTNNQTLVQLVRIKLLVLLLFILLLIAGIITSTVIPL